MPTRRLAAAALLAALLGCLTACGDGGGRAPAATAARSSVSAPASSSPPPSTAPASTSPASGTLPSPAHVVVVVFENKDAEAVSSSDAPYLTGLAAQGAAFTDAHGVTHPSQPNYLALFSGSTQGVSDDSCPQSFSGPNLAGQLLAAGRTFAGYSEGLPAPGFTGCSAGEYARKHNPWVDFPALPASVNQPLSALPHDLAQLPTVAFVVPNLCSDMHSCPVATGDAWARTHLSGYVAWARTHDGLLVVTFDEDEGTAANHIPTFLVGPMVRPGASAQRIDHYDVLRTIEDLYGLAPLGRAASAQPLTGIWSP